MVILSSIGASIGKWLLTKFGTFLFGLMKFETAKSAVKKEVKVEVEAVENIRKEIYESKKQNKKINQDQRERLRNANRRLASGFFKR